MNRMTSIAALACGFAFTALSPALAQPQGSMGSGKEEENIVREGLETDTQIDKAQREELRRKDSSGRSSTTQPAPRQHGPEMGSGEEEGNIVREGLEKPPMK